MRRNVHQTSQGHLAAVAGLLVLFGFMPGVGQAASPASAQTVSATCRFEPPQFTPASPGYTTVTVEGCESRAPTGSPRLPFRVVRLALPPGADVAGVSARPEGDPVPLEGSWKIDFERRPQPLALQPGVASRIPGGPDAAVYRSSKRIPRDRVELLSVQRLAGYDIAVLRVFPLQYAPDTGRLVFTPVLRVELALMPADAASPRLVARAGSAARTQARDRAADFVDNPSLLDAEEPAPAAAAPAGSIAAAASGATFDYLLVTASNLLAAFQPLVMQKTADGLAVRTETMESIVSHYTGRDSAEKLRNAIRFAYTNWGVAYVLLGGDSDVVPTRFAYGRCVDTDLAIPCDLYFACLDGSWNRDNDALWGEPTDGDSGGDVDLIAEVTIGRAPVATPGEAAVFVEKTVRYETGGAARPFQALCVGEYLGSAGAQGGNALDTLLPPLSNGSYRVDWLDDRPSQDVMWQPSDGLAALNGAPHLVLHHGHADSANMMRLGVPDLDGLSNPAPFFFYSAACDAGAFDNPFYSPDCIGEELVKRNAFGAFGAILNSRAGWYLPEQEWTYSGEFQRAFLDQLLTRGNNTLGKAHQAAKQALLGLVERSGDMPYRWCYFDLVLFGDPHVPVVTPVMLGMGAPPAGANAGFVLRWNSITNRLYAVERTTNLASSAFVCLASNLVATPPMNTYTDRVTGGSSGFYRVKADRR